jgi:hypothetical protein
VVILLQLKLIAMCCLCGSVPFWTDDPTPRQLSTLTLQSSVDSARIWVKHLRAWNISMRTVTNLDLFFPKQPHLMRPTAGDRWVAASPGHEQILAASVP